LYTGGASFDFRRDTDCSGQTFRGFT
jgi:hypothetical protein